MYGENMDYIIEEEQPVKVETLDLLLEGYKIKAEECRSWEKYLETRKSQCMQRETDGAVSELTEIWKEWLEHSEKDCASEIETTPSRVYYLKAHALANSALMREPTEKRARRLYDIERSWYENQHPLTYEEHQALTQTHTQLLLELRERMRDNFDSLKDEASALVIDDGMFGPKNLHSMESFSRHVHSISKACKKDFINVVKSIFQSSIDLLGKKGLAPPCPFAIIGMGSVAEGDVSSYSDLDYSILVESNKDLEYFDRLTADIAFRVVNLGETPLKSYNIFELKSGSDSRCRTTFDGHPNVGLMIRDIDPSFMNQLMTACRTFTVQGMLDIYAQEIDSPSNKQEDRTVGLATSIVLLSHDTGQMLHDRFHDLRSTYEHREIVNRKVLSKRLLKLGKDVENYPLLPTNLNFSTDTIRSIKADIFRLPHLLVANLCSMTPLNGSDLWEKLEELVQLEMLTDESKTFLHFIMAASIFIESCAFLSYNTRQESLTFHANDLHHIPRNLFLIMGCLLVPMSKAIARSAETARKQDASVETKEAAYTLKSITQTLHVSINDFILKAKILYYIGDSITAYELLERRMGRAAFCDSERYRQAVCEYYINIAMDFEQEALALAAIVSFRIEDFHTAQKYFQHLLECDIEPQTLWTYQHAHSLCLAQLGDYQNALKQLQCILEQISDHLNVGEQRLFDCVIHLLDQHHILSAEDIITITFLACVFLDLSSLTLQQNEGKQLGNEKIVECLDWASKINQKLFEIGKCSFSEYLASVARYYDILGNMHDRGNNNQNTLEYCKKALELRMKIHGETTIHPELAKAYSSLGLAHQATNNLNGALDCHMTSLTMRRALRLNSDIAESLSNIGLVYSMMKKHITAMDYGRRASAEIASPYSRNFQHAQATNIYRNTADTFASATDGISVAGSKKKVAHLMNEAVRYYKKALDQKIRRCNDTMNIIHCHVGIANAQLKIYEDRLEPNTGDIYKSMRTKAFRKGQQDGILIESTNRLTKIFEYEEAIVHYRMGLEESLSTYGECHETTIKLYDALAKVYNQYRKHEDALDSLFLALANAKKVFSVENHPIIQNLRNGIATSYEGMFEYGIAIQHYAEALQASDGTEDEHGMFVLATIHFGISKNFLRLHKVWDAYVHAQECLQYCNLLLADNQKKENSEWCILQKNAVNLSETLHLVVMCQETFPLVKSRDTELKPDLTTDFQGCPDGLS